MGQLSDTSVPPGDKNKINLLVDHLSVHPCFLLACIVTRFLEELNSCIEMQSSRALKKCRRKHPPGSIVIDGKCHFLGVSYPFMHINFFCFLCLKCLA